MWILLCCQIVRYTIVNRFRRICCRKGKGLVPKKPVNLCVCENEDHEYGLDTGVNSTMLSDTLEEVFYLKVSWVFIY